MLLLLLLSSLSLCLAPETTALAGPSISDSPSSNSEESLFVGKIRSFIKEHKECRASNKELILEMSKIRKDIEDIKEYIKKNYKKISEVEDGVRKVNTTVTNNVGDIVELRKSLAQTFLNVKAKGNSSNITDDVSEDMFSSTISNQKQEILNKNNMNKLNDISKRDNNLPYSNTHMETTETPLDKKTDAILITGGDGAEKSAEVFLPWQNTTCELPPLPDHRHCHVQSGNTLCGGGYSPALRSCLKWSGQLGGWVMLPFTLIKQRKFSSVWRVSQDNSLVIIGGENYGAKKTSEIVSSDGDNTRSTFWMRYPTRSACSIPLDDGVVLTGGISEGLPFLVYPTPRVSLYNRGGWVRDMPSLKSGRAGHGCTSFSTGGEQVLLVTGGNDGDNKLDSTEMLRPGSGWQEITSARLPRPLEAVRVSTLDNRVLLFGGKYGGFWTREKSEDILEYGDGDGWRKVGTMKNGRADSAVSNVKYEEFKDYCN